jgi:copper chaperone NosL
VKKLVGSLTIAVFSCAAAGPTPPAELDAGNEQCRFCRMMVSDPRRAAQIVAPYEDPLFFDDIGCMRDYLASGPSLPRGAVAYVADHRTEAWVFATEALYTRNPAVETPMGSHLVAHADARSRDLDPEAREGTRLSPSDVFGPSGLPLGDAEK